MMRDLCCQAVVCPSDGFEGTKELKKASMGRNHKEFESSVRFWNLEEPAPGAHSPA